MVERNWSVSTCFIFLVSTKEECSMKIRIEAIPPGFAPEKIRKQWVGIEIPLSDDGVILKDGRWTGTENENGYVVFTADAVRALREAGRLDAAEYWEGISFLGSVLRFKRELCSFVQE